MKPVGGSYAPSAPTTQVPIPMSPSRKPYIELSIACCGLPRPLLGGPQDVFAIVYTKGLTDPNADSSWKLLGRTETATLDGDNNSSTNFISKFKLFYSSEIEKNREILVNFYHSFSGKLLLKTREDFIGFSRCTLQHVMQTDTQCVHLPLRDEHGEFQGKRLGYSFIAMETVNPINENVGLLNGNGDSAPKRTYPLNIQFQVNQCIFGGPQGKDAIYFIISRELGKSKGNWVRVYRSSMIKPSGKKPKSAVLESQELNSEQVFLNDESKLLLIEMYAYSAKKTAAASASGITALSSGVGAAAVAAAAAAATASTSADSNASMNAIQSSGSVGSATSSKDGSLSNSLTKGTSGSLSKKLSGQLGKSSSSSVYSAGAGLELQKHDSKSKSHHNLICSAVVTAASLKQLIATGKAISFIPDDCSLLSSGHLYFSLQSTVSGNGVNWSFSVGGLDWFKSEKERDDALLKSVLDKITTATVTEDHGTRIAWRGSSFKHLDSAEIEQLEQQMAQQAPQPQPQKQQPPLAIHSPPGSMPPSTRPPKPSGGTPEQKPAPVAAPPKDKGKDKDKDKDKDKGAAAHSSPNTNTSGNITMTELASSLSPINAPSRNPAPKTSTTPVHDRLKTEQLERKKEDLPTPFSMASFDDDTTEGSESRGSASYAKNLPTPSPPPSASAGSNKAHAVATAATKAGAKKAPQQITDSEEVEEVEGVLYKSASGKNHRDSWIPDDEFGDDVDVAVEEDTVELQKLKAKPQLRKVMLTKQPSKSVDD